jgi:hypothetical protein
VLHQATKLAGSESPSYKITISLILTLKLIVCIRGQDCFRKFLGLFGDISQLQISTVRINKIEEYEQIK